MQEEANQHTNKKLFKAQQKQNLASEKAAGHFQLLLFEISCLNAQREAQT